MSHGPRFSELRQLLFGDDGLTPEETRYLKCLFSRYHMVDLVGSLPLEIVIPIALELGLPDFASCLGVSRVWRRAFLSESVMLAYADRNWPALSDGVVSRSRFLNTLKRLGCQPRSYDCCKARESVRWDKRAHMVSKDEVDGEDYDARDDEARYALDQVFHSQPGDLPGDYLQFSTRDLNRSTNALYAFGKVAYNPCGVIIVVDDLQSRTRKVFTPPSGTIHGLRLRLHSLSSRLVVGGTARLMVAWDHVENHAYQQLLPRPILRCTAQKSRVAVTLRGGDIVIWSPGRPAIQLDLSRPILELGMDSTEAEAWKFLLTPFFDPRNDDNIFLASYYEVRDVVRFRVVEFLAPQVASWSSDHDHAWLSYKYPRGFMPLGREDWDRSGITEYEFEHSLIIFEYFPVAFDKIKRKFIHRDVRLDPLAFHLDSGDLDFGDLDSGDSDFGDLDFGDLDSGDLDFGVRFGRHHYHVFGPDRRRPEP